MTDERTDKTRYELLRVIGALQDAFAYAMHAEQIARDAGAKGDGMRIAALRSRINAAIDHAAIIRDNCHPECDYFISQTYVEPKHRRKGLMSAFFKQWLDEHKGATLCMFIIDNNEIAKKFWFSLMPSIGYEPMYLTEVLPPDGYTTQYGWRPKRD